MERFDNGDFVFLTVELPDEIKYYKYSGDFTGELEAIEHYIREYVDMPYCLSARLRLEKAIATAMKDDYRTDGDTLISAVREKFPHFDTAALRHCMDKGHADFILRDGKPFFQRAAKSNILNCCSDYLETLEGRTPVKSVNAQRHENAAIMCEQGSRAFRFQVRISIKPKPEFERPGKTLRIHLPYPCECDEQSEIKLISSSDPVFISDAAQRTAFIEACCVAGKEYFAEFSYINRAVYHRLDENKVITNPVDTEQNVGLYINEQYPHIRFTSYLCCLADMIAGGETNPLIKAKRVYNWITENVGYSYMRHYLCLDNIAENAALNRRGDCGVQALLFITLCRILGIPARWQSGCAVRPGHIGDHDWAQFYIEPYGWLYADPSYGGGAYRSGDLEMRDYYFGNLDCFRLVCATEFQDRFVPDKYYMRRDPYDNQEGEIEYEDENLFFGQVDSEQILVSTDEIK